MSMYNVYVRTAHGNTRVYCVAALSELAAKRECMQYGRVTYAMRLHGVTAVR
jgi:hypothetical protein